MRLLECDVRELSKSLNIRVGAFVPTTWVTRYTCRTNKTHDLYVCWADKISVMM